MSARQVIDAGLSEADLGFFYTSKEDRSASILRNVSVQLRI